MTLLTLISILSFWASADAVYHPWILNEIGQRVVAEARAGRQPIVIFDLDDTLINTRERNLRILRDFSGQSATQRRYPAEAEQVSRLELGDVKYLLKDTLRRAGIVSEDFIRMANDYWLESFFTDAYCAFDEPNPSGPQYVRYLARLGAKVIYLTGRDAPRMGRGTVYNLKRNGFPLDAEYAVLQMKPSKVGDDLAFKISALESIVKQGVVVASFENEPRNINAMKLALPDSLMVFVDTIHSSAPDVPDTGVFWIRDFQAPVGQAVDARKRTMPSAEEAVKQQHGG